MKLLVSSFFGDSEAGAVELPSLFGVSDAEVSEATSLVEDSETGVLNFPHSLVFLMLGSQKLLH